MLPEAFKIRKAERTEHYFRYIFRWKLRKCLACNGSGWYDDGSGRHCQGCDPPGSGKERYQDK